MQIELIREILDIKNVKVLESVKKMLIHAKAAEDEKSYMTKNEIMDGLAEACKDIKLMREGKLKGRPIEELLNEL